MATAARSRHVWQTSTVAAVCALALLPLSAAQTGPARWERVQHPALEGGGGVAYVQDVEAPSGRSWLAAGFTVDSDGVRQPSVWESGDGIRWRRTVLPRTPSTERRDGVQLVARRGATVVAIGERFTDLVRNAAWYRRGGAWQVLRDPADPLLAFEGRIVALTATAEEFFALGVLQTTSTSTARVFHSVDGRDWKLHSELSGGGKRFQPYDIAAVGGRIVVVGAVLAGTVNGAIWTWANGDWRRVNPRTADLVGPGRDQVSAVAFRRGTGFVAGGMTTRRGVELPAGWTSPDGVAWKRLPDGALASPGRGAAVHDIAVTNTGFVAAGNTANGAVLWRSASGRRWNGTAAPYKAHSGGESVRVAATARIAVLTVTREHGSYVYRRGPRPTWVAVDRPPAFPAARQAAAELRDVAVAGSRIVSVGEDSRGRPLVMLSGNGTSWSRAPFPDSAARLRAVAASNGTIAVVGARIVRGTSYLAVWTSRNGRRWARVGGTRRDVVGAFVDVALDRGGFLALAYEATSRGLHTSVWSGRGATWRTDAILGRGEARSVCVGPHGATAVAVRDARSADQLVVWQRPARGTWSAEPELVATNVDANGCADAPFGTVVVGSDRHGAGVLWAQPEPGTRWTPRLLQTRGSLYEVTRDGNSVLLTGSGVLRGQVDLVAWRVDGAGLGMVGGGDPQFSAPGFQSGLGIVGHRGRIVIVGRSGAGDAAIWIGREPKPDGDSPDGV